MVAKINVEMLPLPEWTTPTNLYCLLSLKWQLRFPLLVASKVKTYLRYSVAIFIYAAIKCSIYLHVGR